MPKGMRREHPKVLKIGPAVDIRTSSRATLIRTNFSIAGSQGATPRRPPKPFEPTRPRELNLDGADGEASYQVLSVGRILIENRSDIMCDAADGFFWDISKVCCGCLWQYRFGDLSLYFQQSGFPPVRQSSQLEPCKTHPKIRKGHRLPDG